MKDLLKNIDKSSTLLTICYKSFTYILWYMFAIIFSIFIYDYLTDTKILILILFIIGIYLFRNLIKYLYNKISNKTIHNIKHNIELEYFKKIEDSNLYYNDSELKNIDNMILDISYKFTKLVMDIGEIIIPLIIGLFILYFKLFSINIIVSLISLIYLAFLIIKKYKEIEVSQTCNYNDLLHDYIAKFDTIRKLKIFDFCYKKLEENNENDMVLLNKNDNANDIFFSNGLIIYLLILLLTVFFTYSNNITRIGLFLFIIVMMLKIQNLLSDLPYTIKNITTISKYKKELDMKYKEPIKNKSIKKWNSVKLENVSLQYKNPDIEIKVPFFELLKGDSIGILGKSGQGKSTILNILSGMNKMSSGAIIIDDKEAKYPIDVIYISKNVKIFKMSLRDNICFSKKISDEKLLDLIDEIGLLEWYSSLENGLDTILYEVNDSILRLINLLRAIVSDEEVYFFDEITLGLNLESEKKVVNMLKKYFVNKTFIIISDRPILNNICQKHYFIKNHTLLEKESLL